MNRDLRDGQSVEAGQTLADIVNIILTYFRLFLDWLWNMAMIS